MIKTVLSTTAVIALAAGSAAYAGGMEPAAPEPMVAAPPAPMDTSGDWGGFYGGAALGYGFGDADDGAMSVDFDGVIGGLFAGYNWDLGDYVLGIEGDYNFADLQFDDPFSAISVDQVARIKLRGGLDMGRTLVYVVGGAAYANADSPAGDNSDWGYAVGAGADYQITDRWVGGVEYLYHGFSDFDGQGVDINAHTIQARLSMRF